MSEQGQRLFLERQTYRNRRLIDAARLFPVLGVFLFMLPLLWPRTSGSEVSTSSAILYLFGAWLALVIVSAQLSRRLRDTGADVSNSPDNPSAEANGREDAR